MIAFIFLYILLKLNITSKQDDFNTINPIINEFIKHLPNGSVEEEWVEPQDKTKNNKERVEPQSIEEQVEDRPPVQEESADKTKTAEDKDYDDEYDMDPDPDLRRTLIQICA